MSERISFCLAVACVGENDEFVELKTSRTPQHPGQIRTLLKFKYPRWWLQSWLAGIKHILVGSWTSNGQLEQIQRLRTTDLPRLSAEKGESWDPWECMHPDSCACNRRFFSIRTVCDVDNASV